ncbi:hypothetical protein ACH5RR_041716 [Cinchona calisaya]|uniref:PPM-type phosphatase domain-containing protein n=1 Tax=Cinchona calisaya TaxID=153742 RepID=A0ABD2XXN5_9GENT
MKSTGVVDPPSHFAQMLPEEATTSYTTEGRDKEFKGVVENHPGGLLEEEVARNKVEESSGSMTRLNFGSLSVVGRRRMMEDALTVAPPPGMLAGEYEFFATYDGHGGARVANACQEKLHLLLQNELELELQLGGDRYKSIEGKIDDWTKIMKACFSKMDGEVAIDDSNVGEEERAVGSTAVVVMVGPEELVVANCGDSRAVLCRDGMAMPLSTDHKPDRPDEKERVEAAGGRVINWEGCRVQGVLATSRSIGDHYLKPYVISEPEVTVNKRTDSDDFIIIATDGLWDVVSNDVACDVVRRYLNGRMSKKVLKEPGAAEAAAILAELAIAKGSRDNISVIVVDLKKVGSKVPRT